MKQDLTSPLGSPLINRLDSPLLGNTPEQSPCLPATLPTTPSFEVSNLASDLEIGVDGEVGESEIVRDLYKDGRRYGRRLSNDLRAHCSRAGITNKCRIAGTDRRPCRASSTGETRASSQVGTKCVYAMHTLSVIPTDTLLVHSRVRRGVYNCSTWRFPEAVPEDQG